MPGNRMGLEAAKAATRRMSVQVVAMKGLNCRHHLRHRGAGASTSTNPKPPVAFCVPGSFDCFLFFYLPALINEAAAGFFPRRLEMVETKPLP
ncbi:hypothetical protein O3P69_007456 [Scylla paramamosain]|uniref:Uncharacterized protein n=1 Tax=Scylla paramamosain TaxID=85552 RepID=A0AAW0V4T6_SCYPA